MNKEETKEQQTQNSKEKQHRTAKKNNTVPIERITMAINKKERPQNKNLKPPINKRTTREAREISKNGGIKSGKKRRELKEIREWLEQDLFEEHQNSRGEKAETFKIIFNKLKAEALKGNTKAIEMYLNYAGLKPTDKVETTLKGSVKTNVLSIEKLRELKEKLEA
jgi:hypothetical protein